MASKPIRVQLMKAAGGYPKGAELGFESEAKAASVLGEGAFKVLAYQNGEAWDAPKKPAAKKDEK